MSDGVDVYAEIAIAGMRKDWKNLVQVAETTALDDVSSKAKAMSSQSRVGAESIERKLRAIQYARSTGILPETIVEIGQERTVSLYNTSRKVEQSEKQVQLRWLMSGSLRDQIEIERTRIMSLLHFTNSEQFALWLHAQLASASDQEIKHSAGE